MNNLDLNSLDINNSKYLTESNKLLPNFDNKINNLDIDNVTSESTEVLPNLNKLNNIVTKNTKSNTRNNTKSNTNNNKNNNTKQKYSRANFDLNHLYKNASNPIVGYN